MFLYILLFHLMLQACKRPFQASCIHWDQHLGPDTCMASTLSHLVFYLARTKIYNCNSYDVIDMLFLKWVEIKSTKDLLPCLSDLPLSTNKEKTPPRILLSLSTWMQCFVPSRSARQCIQEGVAQLTSCLSKGDINGTFKGQTWCGMLFDTIHDIFSEFQISWVFYKSFTKEN